MHICKMQSMRILLYCSRENQRYSHGCHSYHSINVKGRGYLNFVYIHLSEHDSEKTSLFQTKIPRIFISDFKYAPPPWYYPLNSCDISGYPLLFSVFCFEMRTNKVGSFLLLRCFSMTIFFASAVLLKLVPLSYFE